MDEVTVVDGGSSRSCLAPLWALGESVEALAPQLATVQRALASGWARIEPVVAEWARLESLVADGRRRERHWTVLLDADAAEADRRQAAEAIAATFPVALCGGKRRWRALCAWAQELGQPRHSVLQNLFACGLMDAAHPRGPSAALTSCGRTDRTAILTVHRQGSMPRRGLRVLAEATLRP